MEYAQKREAFGRPISKFQTIQVKIFNFCTRKAFSTTHFMFSFAC